MKPIVFDNIIFSLQRAGGISRVWSDILKYVAPRVPSYRVLEYKHAMENYERLSLSCRLPWKGISGHIPLGIERMRAARIEDCDIDAIFHSSYYRVPSHHGMSTVITVHDFTVERFDKRFPHSHLHHIMKARAINRADAIVCISESTREDLLRFFPHTDRKRVHVVYNSVDEAFRPLGMQPYPELADAVVFVGNRKTYKNFNRVIETVSRTDLRLCVCGEPLTSAEIQVLDNRLKDRWINFVFPDDVILNKIYNSCHSLINLSLWEGFGLTVAEARSAGCPVVALNHSGISEIAGGSPSLCGKDDISSLTGILNRLKSNGFRQECIAHGLADRRFTSQNFAQGYLDVYDML